MGLAIIIIMLLESVHVPEWAREKKRRAGLGDEAPLVLVVGEDFSFMGGFAEAVLSHHNFPMVVKHFQGSELMGYPLPILCFEDTILSRDNLLEFLSDAALGHLPVDQYLLRKENLKRIYRAWYSIFHYQSQVSHKGDLSFLARDDLSNLIYEELLNFSKDVVNKGYERVFTSYRDEEWNPEACLMVDITEAILHHFQREKCDYVLRADFSQQIDYVNRFKARPEALDASREEERKYVLMDAKLPAAPNCPKTSFNLKWFSGILVGLAFIFGKWAH